MKEMNTFYLGTAVLFLFFFLFSHGDKRPSYIAYGKEGIDTDEVTVLFTGDIMLAREVERIIERTSPHYPFAGVAEYIAHADIAVGNFEGSVSEKHEETPDFGFKFSVESPYLFALKDIGFDYLSLANNHALDFGYEGYMHTRNRCLEVGLICGGTPGRVEAISHSVLQAGSTKVGILSLETVSGVPDMETLGALVRTLSDESDIQIAYVHWGEEYETGHNKTQEYVAHYLVEEGIDAVIGHHPHVVADVEIYNDAPIFYSLGNLVFDQYFDEAVQEGLMVQLSVSDTRLRYTLIPVTSVDTPSQPRLMGLDARDEFLAERALRPVFSFSRKRLAERPIISTMSGHK